MVAAVTQDANDKAQLVPLLTQVAVNCGRHPAAASADVGHFSAARVTDKSQQGIDLYAPPDRQPYGERSPADSDPAA